MSLTSTGSTTLGAAALARRLYQHKLHGGTLQVSDIARLVEIIETLEGQLQAVEAAFAPVQDHYRPDSGQDKPLAYQIADAVAELRKHHAAAAVSRDEAGLPVIYLSNADFAAIDAVIANPKEPTPAMLAAVKRYRDMIASGKLVVDHEPPSA